jgi:hypothetical protein
VLRTALAVPPDFDLALLIALGYPDMDSPVNAFRSPREELGQMVQWIGVKE